MTPGLKFSTTTSAVATSRRTASTAAGDLRSRATLFLPALSWPKLVLAPLRIGGRVRIMSPSGASILITSAARSANMRVQCGPAIVVVKSSTRRPDNAPFIAYSPMPEFCRRDRKRDGKCQAVSAPKTDMRLAFTKVWCQESRGISREVNHGVSQHTGGNGDLSRTRRGPRRRVLRAPDQCRAAPGRGRDPSHAGLG